MTGKNYDSDLLKRKQSGVRRYHIFRTIDKPNFVIIEFELDNLQNAETMHEALKKLWNRVEGKVMMSPQSRIVEAVESIELT